MINQPINQQKLIMMECTNLDINTLNKRQSKKNSIKSSTDSINNSTIVFNNQTNKLIKQQDLNDKQLTPIMGKYNLRKKSSPVKTRTDSIKKPNQIDTKHLRGLIEDDKKPKKRNTSLSKYKRKHANARERSRVQEINAAFEILKNILPLDVFEQLRDNNRLTKISTLRSATKYIKILLEILNEKPTESINNEIKDCDNTFMNKQQELNQKSTELTNNNEIKNCANLTINTNNKQESNSLPNIDISPNELSRLSFNEEFDELNKQTTNIINNQVAINNITSILPVENSNQPLSTESEMLNSIIDFDAPIECEFNDDLSDIKNDTKNNIQINIPQSVNYNQINITPIRNEIDVQLNIQYHQLNSSPLNPPQQQLNCINSNFKYFNNTLLHGSNNKYSKFNSLNTPLIEKNNDHNLPTFYFDTITKLNEPIFKDEDILNFLGEDIENGSFQYSTGDLMI